METNVLIEQLAQKLGTTTEYLWDILLKQAPIQSFISLFELIIIILFGFVLYKIHKRFSVKSDYTDRDGYRHEGSLYSQYEEKIILPMIVGGLIFICLVMYAFCSINEIFNGFFNPEYWALEQILNTFK